MLLLICALGLAYGVVSGQDDPPVPRGGAISSERPNELEGNWLIEWEGEGRALAVLRRQWELKRVEVFGGSGGYYNRVSQTDKRWVLDYTTDLQNWGGGYPQVDPERKKLEIQWGYHTFGTWGGRSELQQTGPNEIRGGWVYAPAEKGGGEVWRRVLPDIKRVVFKGVSFYDYSAQFAKYDDPSSTIESVTTLGGTPGQVEGTYGSVKGWGPDNDMRGNRPKFKVQFYGENLWGHHLIDLDGALDLEPLPYWTYIMKGGGRYSSIANRVQEVEGIELEVVIWPQARPGRYELRVDGISIPFDLDIKGYPGGATPSERGQDITGTPARDSLPSEAIPIIVVGAIAGLALANRVSRRLPRRSEPPAQAVDLRADVDAAKAEFERLQQALRERVNRELADVQAFNREFDERWAAAMEALEDYMKRYPELLPGLTALMEQASSREFARQVAQWADTTLNAAMIGQGIVKAGLGTAQRAGVRTVKRSADVALDVRPGMAKPRRPRPKKAISPKLPPSAKTPIEKSAQEAAEAREKYLAARQEVLETIKGVNPWYSVPKDKGTRNCISCALATDARLAGNLEKTALPGGPYSRKWIERVFGTNWKMVANDKAGFIQLRAQMEAAGDGARGIVIVRRGATQHAFNAVNKNGQILFPDGQVGRMFDGWNTAKDIFWIRTN